MSELTHARRIEIQALLQEFSDYWHEHAELRFGQVVSSFTPPQFRADPFYVEDYQFHFAFKHANTPPDSEPLV